MNIYIFIKGTLNWSKAEVNVFIKCPTSNKCCLYENSIHYRILENKQNKMCHSFHKNIKQQNCFQYW